jgi:hypothetical protein
MRTLSVPSITAAKVFAKAFSAEHRICRAAAGVPRECLVAYHAEAQQARQLAAARHRG